MPLGGALLRNRNSSTKFRYCALIRILEARLRPAQIPLRGTFCQKQMRFAFACVPLAKVAPLDSEIAADLLVVEYVRLLGRLAHLFDGDRVEIGEKGFARPSYGRIDHPLEQHRV